LFALSDALECWFAYKLFSLYVVGDWFAPRTVQWLRWIGLLSLLRGGGNIWSTLHAHLHDGFFSQVQSSPLLVQAVIYARFAFTELLHNLVFGCVIIFIAWIMDKGREMQEEQALTV
jgi:hypothetical protein